MDDIVLATPEQVERIRANSDLGPGCTVYAMGEDLAVFRTVAELDPVHFAPESRTSRRLMLIWGLQNMMRANGIPAYYANVHATDTEWLDTIKNYGFVPTSTEPEIRLKKVL